MLDALKLSGLRNKPEKRKIVDPFEWNIALLAETSVVYGCQYSGALQKWLVSQYGLSPPVAKPRVKVSSKLRSKSNVIERPTYGVPYVGEFETVAPVSVKRTKKKVERPIGK